jgi:outer membrane protein assembly factor BamB
MRTRTAAALAALLVVLAGGVAAGLLRGEGSGSVTVRWESDTALDVGGNHHAAAAARVDGRGLVFAPVSGTRGTDHCRLAALDAGDGTGVWSHPVPPENCTVHAVADPAVGDYDADGDAEVLAATTERELLALDPGTGDVEASFALESYGYTRPVVADVVGDGRPETVVVDVSGAVHAFRADGTVAWTRSVDSRTWSRPAVADVDGDGDPEVAVGGADGLRLFAGDGSPEWDAPVPVTGSITWMTTGRVDGDGDPDLVVATAAGVVAAVDDDGTVRWERDLGRLAAVRAVVDGDDDGTAEVYAVARDGVLSALDADSGATEWTTTLTDGDVQMAPPPTAGDVDGDGDPELVAVTNDGVLALVDPDSGAVLGTHEREGASVYARPTLSDLDGDGDPEAVVVYADAHVAAFDFDAA